MDKKIKHEDILKQVDDLNIKPPMPKKIIKTFDELPSNWKEIYYDLALDGSSDVELYTSVSTTRRYHESMLSVPEYAEWFNFCHELSVCWWYQFGKDICKSKSSNSATYSLIMQNRCNWISSNQIGKTATPTDETKPTDSEPVKSLDDFKTPAPEPQVN